VLDCFSHVGPFGLNAAAGGAEFVRCVDVSQTACDLAAANARLNGFEGVMGFTCADVLDYLPSLRNRKRMTEEGGPFDLIVLDPPAFTKSRSTARAAERGYREINQAALRMLPRGGYLATCSCSHFMPEELFADDAELSGHASQIKNMSAAKKLQTCDLMLDHLKGNVEFMMLDKTGFEVVKQQLATLVKCLDPSTKLLFAQNISSTETDDGTPLINLLFDVFEGDLIEMLDLSDATRKLIEES
jgi:23S rRNA (cytosine1962-C5)-methyltransferase